MNMATTSDRIDELLQLLGVSQTRDDLIKNTSDSFPLVCTEIFSSVEQTTDRADAFKELLQLLPEVAPVKELLINLLLQMDTFKEDAVFFLRCYRQ
jgi:fructose-1,6-bisphosphatase